MATERLILCAFKIDPDFPLEPLEVKEIILHFKEIFARVAFAKTQESYIEWTQTHRRLAKNVDKLIEWLRGRENDAESKSTPDDETEDETE